MVFKLEIEIQMHFRQSGWHANLKETPCYSSWFGLDSVLMFLGHARFNW